MLKSHITKVWPLKHGLKGVNSQGEEIELQPGVAGYMLDADAIKADKAGNVQIMAGQTPQSLKKPDYSTAAMSTVAGDDPPVSNAKRGQGRRGNYKNRNLKTET